MMIIRKLIAKFFKEEPLDDKGSSLRAYHDINSNLKGDNAVWLIVGLGNPGEKYRNNRHNVGFIVLDEIAEGVPPYTPFKKSKFQGDITEARVGNDKIILLKPQTYMNESGRSVAQVARFYKIAPENIIIIHDELDLKSGEIRTKKGGGNAGHNGLKSIQAHLGTPDFWRIRIGIGHPGQKEMVSGYVLSDFAKTETDRINQICDLLRRSHVKIVENGAQSYMTEINAFAIEK